MRGRAVLLGLLLVAAASGPAAAGFDYRPPAAPADQTAPSLAAALEAVLPIDMRVRAAAGVDLERLVPAAISLKPGPNWRDRLAEIGRALALEHAVAAPPGRAFQLRIWPRGAQPEGLEFRTVRPPGRWTAEPDETLQEVLARWTDTAGINLHWEAPCDWRLDDPVRLGGSFRNAAGTLLAALAHIDPPPAGVLLRDGTVLAIRVQEAHQ